MVAKGEGVWRNVEGVDRCVYSISYDEGPSPTFGEREFIVQWGHKSGVLIQCARKRHTEEEETPEMHICRGEALWRHRRRCSLKVKRGFPRNQSYCPLILDFLHPEMWENDFLLFKAPSLWYSVRQSERTSTVSKEIWL